MFNKSDVTKCPHCGKCWFTFKDEDNIYCPYCRKNLSVFTDIFNQFFGDDPFDGLGIT